MPTASVIMPCYNSAGFVRKSVEAILNQTFRDFDLIIVDDASTDGSAAVLRDLAAGDARIKLIFHQNNRGASNSRNDGLRQATGDYVGFCDADDIWMPEKLGTQIRLLEENPSFDLTYCDSQIIDEEGNLTGELFSDQFTPPRVPSGNLFKELCARNFVNMQTVLVRRSALGEGIFFDESVKWVEDWWQWIRLSAKHQFLYEARTLAQYRVHRHSTGFTQRPGIRRNRWKVCKRNLCTHHNMPLREQALLWHQMGIELSSLGWHRLAQRFFCHAIYLGLKGRSPIRNLIAMLGWWSIEGWRRVTVAFQK